jgi:mannose-6-phosphate isomerase-like protein (cupin superfamily)
VEYTPISLAEKFEKFRDQWSPKVIARMNDYEFKLVRVEGEFVWHSHAETDETFIVIDGSMIIEFRQGELRLSAGEMFIVPRGVEHRPRAATECKILLIEPAGTVNTGDAGGAFTAANDVWI